VSNKRQKIYLYIILAYAFIGLFNAFIANSKPIVAKDTSGIVFPAMADFIRDFGFSDKGNYSQRVQYSWALYPPIKYHAKDIDVGHSGFKSPSQCTEGSGHYLGTDQVGRDVAAGIVRGCYTSFRIGIFGTLLCGLIGIFIGLCMAYYGNRIKLNILEVIASLLFIILALFYIIFPLQQTLLNTLLVTLLLVFAFGNHYLIGRLNIKKYDLPFDKVMMGIIELRRSMPVLILLLVLFPLFNKPSINNVILVIALLGWTNFARHARSESLSIKNRPFVTVSQMMGADFFHIGWKHLLPNITTTMLVIASMNFASNVLLESTLSFLGMGLPPEEVSWGSMLSDGRKNYFAWWMVLFPGIALFILVYCINKVADLAAAK
jgi:peptide/nickel transport system permease protein